MTTNIAEEEFCLQSLVVLIVDGDDAARAETQAALARACVGSDVYANGEKAMEMIRLHHARRQEYDLILVDISLPDANGEDFVREIRACLGENDTVILLTAKDAADGETKARNAGADAFLAKPFSEDDVLRAFRQAHRRKPSEPTQEEAAKHLDGRRILVAEDMAVNAEIVKQLLSMNFMAVDHAKNGKEAVDLFVKSPADYYDAILMDVRMPVMDGLAATEAIRASDHPNAKTVPIIALTTNYFDEDVQRSLAAGMNAHLEKPVEPDQIYRTLAEFVKAR